MPRNHDDLAYFENRYPRCTSTYMSGASPKNSERYLLNSGLCTAFGRPAGRLDTDTHFRTVLLYHYI